MEIKHELCTIGNEKPVGAVESYVDVRARNKRFINTVNRTFRLQLFQLGEERRNVDDDARPNECRTFRVDEPCSTASITLRRSE